MKNFKIVLLILLYVSGFRGLSFTNGQSLTDHVNPFIGTSGGGNTHPGAMVPWGMVSVCPFNVYGEPNQLNIQNRKFGATYKHNNSFLTGFSHINLSGTGCPDLGAVLVMPIHGKLELDPQKYGSAYKDETAKPGFYETTLTKYNIKTRMSATERTGVSEYHLPAGESHILVNLGLALTPKEGGYLKITAPNEVTGMRNTGGFCGRNHISQPVYFIIQLSRDSDDFGAWSGSNIHPQYQRDLAGNNIGAYFTYQHDQEQIITVKVGISYVSIKNARLNLQKETGEATFESILAKADDKWEKQLSRILVEGGSEADKELFYTGLYHILIHPNVFNDVNGDYPILDGTKIKAADNYTRYSIFSLWDTYRNVHPLLSLVYPEVQRDMAVSMIEMYKESGRLPKWELSGRETYVMVGDPACIVLNDTYQRGIRNFDAETAYKAIIKSATDTVNNPIRPENAHYIKYGYIPVELKNRGAVSIQLEYALADWNVAQMANSLNDHNHYVIMRDRAMSYKNIFDKETNFLRPKNLDGAWVKPFDPLKISFGDRSKINGYVEGNAWQYLYFVPHDINGLIKLMGKKMFTTKLEEALSAEGMETGKFGLWNEPDIAYPFLFNYIKGKEWQTSKHVQNCIRKYYSNQPDGLPGNDDCGTMSAWLVFAMMGFYPDCPGNPDFTLFNSHFQKITITLNEDYHKGNKLEIIRKSGDDQQHFVFNGKKLKKPFLSHMDMIKGGVLEIGK